jgi:hypothetical protein
MTIAYHLQYLRMKEAQKQAEESKVRESIQSRNKAFEESVKTRHTSTINMADAYREVVDKNYKPTPEEIHLRRFTSGSWIDSV